MYHSICDHAGQTHPDLVVTPQRFQQQLDYLRSNHYQFCTVSELVNAPDDGQKRVALTFDDGFADNYTQMFPLLQQFQAKATIYLSPEIQGIDILSAQQISAMQQSGLVEFGAHTLHHVNLAQCDTETAWREIIQSKHRVEALCGQPCLSFAYPYGRYTQDTVTLLKQAGFCSAVTVKKGIEPIADPYRIKRISILGKTNRLQFHLALTRGRYRI